jgi:hypothetical protein
MPETLYRKVKNRYVPYRASYDKTSFPIGTHILVIGEGIKSYIYNVPTSQAVLLALIAPLKEKLVEALAKQLEYRPQVKLTDKQVKVWDTLKKELGVEVLSPSSIEEAVRSVLNELASPQGMLTKTGERPL